MKKSTLKIALSCLLGAVIGTFIGLQLNKYIGLYIGMITGGLTGYLLYELPQVIKALPVAWKYATKENPLFKRTFLLKAYQIAKGIVASFTICFIFLFSGATACLVVSGLLDLAFNGQPMLAVPSAWGVVLIVVAVVSLVLAIAAPCESGVKKVVKGIMKDDFLRKRLRIYFLFCNPITLPFTIVFFVMKYLLLGLRFLFSVLPKFAKKLFLLIHSDVRTICGVDAALGAGIGYLSGSAIVGGIAGAILGILNYWVVSIKILKLKPKI